MPNYRRIYGGNAYYFTLVTDHRIPILTTEQARAGLRSYNVDVREGVGEWSRWLTETTQMQADFGGEDGKQYTFRVQGVDRVGNAGAWLETATATTYAVTKYYAMAGQRVAMRQGSSVSYLYGDHLGSTSLITDASGAAVTETRYPLTRAGQPYGQPYWQWGATRHPSGTGRLWLHTLREKHPPGAGRPTPGRLWPDGLQRKILLKHAGTIHLPGYHHPATGQPSGEGRRIAMRQATTLTWLLGDHLGSTTITATENGTLASEQKYTAWGQTRSGSVGTDRQYTGQISEPQLGIYFYNASGSVDTRPAIIG